jgi:glycosyltransferase involved in cell wall biosynthesis
VNTDHSSKRLRILWVHPLSFDDELDAATYLDTTRELREMDCDVTMIASGPDGHREFRGVEVLCISHPDIYFLRQMIFHLKVVGWLFAHWSDVDVILFHEMSTLWMLPLRLVRLLRRTRTPVLVMDTRTVHMPRQDTRNVKIHLRGIFLRFMTWLANLWVDGRTAITRRMATEVNIPAAKLWGVWPSGVQPEPFEQTRDLRRWPAAGEPVEIVYVGALEYERGLMAFCQAVVRAHHEGMRFNFTLVGDGRERADLAEFAATSACVHVLPPVPHEQIPQVLSRGHVGVLPFPDETKFQVSSPIKLFEYMAAGMSILATRIVCHTDVIGEGGYVFWAEQTDEDGLLIALRNVWECRENLQKMGSQAAAAVDDWTWRAAAEKLKQSLEYGLAQRT